MSIFAILQLRLAQIIPPFHQDEEGGLDDVIVKLLLIFIAAVIILLVVLYAKTDLWEAVKGKISELLGQ